MNALLFYVIVAILMFGLLIAVHEWGHYIAAKKLDVQVNEFAIGMGPILWSTQRGETLYSLRAFPIGGFCAMEGEDEASGSLRSFHQKSLWKKLVILCAGSFMNLLLGFLIVLGLTVSSPTLAAPVIGNLEPQFSATGVGTLRAGDRFLAINDRKVKTASDVRTYLALAGGKEMTIMVERGGETVTLTDVTIVPHSYTNSRGEELLRYGINFETLPPTPGRVLSHSVAMTGFYARSVWLGLQMLVSGEAGLPDVAGPVGIVSLIGETSTKAEDVRGGVQNLYGIIALVAVNLAIVNMLPIPALDGGRIFLLLVGRGYHIVTRRDLNPKIEQYLNATCFVLLMLLMLVVTFQDVWRLVV